MADPPSAHNYGSHSAFDQEERLNPEVRAVAECTNEEGYRDWKTGNTTSSQK